MVVVKHYLHGMTGYTYIYINIKCTYIQNLIANTLLLKPSVPNIPTDPLP